MEAGNQKREGEREHDCVRQSSERIPNTFKLLKIQLNTVQSRWKGYIKGAVTGNYVFLLRAKVHVVGCTAFC